MRAAHERLFRWALFALVFLVCVWKVNEAIKGVGGGSSIKGGGASPRDGPVFSPFSRRMRVPIGLDAGAPGLPERMRFRATRRSDSTEPLPPVHDALNQLAGDDPGVMGADLGDVFTRDDALDRWPSSSPLPSTTASATTSPSPPAAARTVVGHGGSHALQEKAMHAPHAHAAVAGAAAVDPYFGSHEDLEAHRGNAECWNHFDFGMLEHWDATAAVFCAPPSLHASGLRASAEAEVTAAAAARAKDPAAQPVAHTMGKALTRALHAAAPPYAAGNESAAPAGLAASAASWLVCRVTVDHHLPAPTAPHTMCDGANIVLDLTRMQPATCLEHRPGYKCDGGPVFYRYGPGALSGTCARQPEFNAGAFPRDHLMDIFSSFEAVPSGPPPQLPPPTLLAGSAATHTLLVTRERGEHANLFHATTDLMNAFFTLHVAGVVAGVAGTRGGMDGVQLLLLDEQAGPFEEALWARLFSPAHPLLRVSALRAAGVARLLLPRPLFVPPGYSNMLLSHVMTEGDCHARTQLLQSYRAFVLRGMGLGHLVSPRDALPPLAEEAAGKEEEGEAGTSSSPRRLRVTLVSRRPYNVAGVDHGSMGRQIGNEEELLEAMRAAAGPAATVSRVDFALLGVEAQIGLVAGTDVLVAMHGAALTYAALLPPHAGVLELWPKDRDIWRCFEHLSTMAGLQYEVWRNTDPRRFRAEAGGSDFTTIDTQQFGALLTGVVQRVREAVARTAAGAPV